MTRSDLILQRVSMDNMCQDHMRAAEKPAPLPPPPSPPPLQCGNTCQTCGIQMSVVVNGSMVDNNVCLWSRTLILEYDSGRSANDELEGKMRRQGNDLGALHQVHVIGKVFLLC